MRVYLFIIISLICCLEEATADRSKQALRAIEKGEFDKAEEYLIRSYEKDSLNPLVSYAYTQLYLDAAYVNQDLDTAHRYVLLAVKLMVDKTEDHDDEMGKAEVDSLNIVNLKLHIDSLGYDRAKGEHTVDSYSFFMDQYKSAIQYEDAETGYVELIFQEVLVQDTWQAYKDFMIDFPVASQVPISQDKYDELIYLDKAKDANTYQLEQFLLEENNTPYRDEIENRIYFEKASGMNVDSLYAFMEKYDNNALDKKSMAILYHLDSLSTARLKKEKKAQGRIFMDSVSRIEAVNHEVLVPFLKEDKYTYHTLSGRQFLTDTFDGINSDHLCGNITDEILKVNDGDTTVLINRLGDEVYRGQIDGYRDLGHGLIAIHQDHVFGVIHKSGFEVLPIRYESVDLLDGRLISYVENGKTGLVGITGRKLLDTNYGNIYLEGAFWVVENDGVFAVTNLVYILSGDSSKVELRYEEVELINEHYIVGYTETHEEVFDIDLHRITPDSTLSAITKYDAWVFRTEKGYYIYDQESKAMLPTLYDRVLQNEEWLGVYNGENWSVYNRNVYQDPILNVDSVKLLGKDIAVVFRGEQGVAIFPNKELVEIKEGQYLQTLNASNKLEAHYLAIGTNNGIALYKDAKLMFIYDCDEIGYINDSFFSVKSGNQYGAVDVNGRLVMRVRYNAIGEAVDGVADVLYQSEFGGYNFTDKILLRLEYDRRIKAYSEGLYLVSKKDQYGLINSENQLLVEPDFDQIKYWSDTTFLGEKSGEWRVYGINNSKPATLSFDGFEYVINTPDEVAIEVRIGTKYGIYHGQKGFVVPPEFNDVMNLGNQETPLYYCEKRFSEAEMYVVVYYDENGEKIKSEAYRGKEYELIVCDN
ncbi:MAG: WG repeat-containing protein [Reichenbachiella sp.]